MREKHHQRRLGVYGVRCDGIPNSHAQEQSEVKCNGRKDRLPQPISGFMIVQHASEHTPSRPVKMLCNLNSSPPKQRYHQSCNSSKRQLSKLDRYHLTFFATPTLVLETFSANFKLVIVSPKHFFSGATMTNISVLQFPPKLNCRR